jgi:hypothetical protein
MHLRMSDVDVPEVSRREHDRSAVQKLGRGTGFTLGREPNSFRITRLHQMRQESLMIPAGEGWPTKLHKIDLYSFPDDILCESLEKRFLRRKLIEGSEDEIHAKNTNRLLLEDIRRISQIYV